MTEATKLYQTDSYLWEFDAVVTKVDTENNAVYLDQSAFYPGGGGQPAAGGTLQAGDMTYTVKKMGRDIAHIIDGDVLPDVGASVHGVVDSDKRYQLMRTHTAMHILCGVVWRDYGASVTGGNMDPLSGRMDFEFEKLGQDTIAEIETKINAEIANARDIAVAILPREEAFQIPDLIRTKINLLPEGIREVRTVEIEGRDLQADGGTHVKNTSEVGAIKITKYKSKGGNNKRLYVEITDAD
ncbi:MAG: alanyl-tRNA editing protein [Chloroflexota bacterium]